MPAISASAPAKTILFGEHAVVYGAPAIAVPISALRAKAIIQPEIQTNETKILLKNDPTSQQGLLKDLPEDDLIRSVIELFQAENNIQLPLFQLTVSSDIPIAAGLGSSAAVAVAIIRALAEFSGFEMEDETLNDIAYQSEVIQHGTPSGIDNSVIAFEKPIFYQKNQPMETVRIKNKIHLILADSNQRVLTRDVVNDVRKLFSKEPAPYQAIFDEIGEIAQVAKKALEEGDTFLIGELMNKNHSLLQQINVSSLKLDQLVQRAINSGAAGAKLCGGGRGGFMVAISTQEKQKDIAEQLRSISPHVIETKIGGDNSYANLP